MLARRQVKNIRKATGHDRRFSVIPIQLKLHRYHIPHPDDSKLPQLMTLDKVRGKFLENLLIQKLELCCLVYDFWDKMSNLRGKYVKTETLIELNTWFIKSKSVINIAIISLMFKMISTNLFRPIFYEQQLTTTENLTDEAWPHLSLVYKFFDTLLNTRSVPISILNNFITDSFVGQLLKNFNSIDSKERFAIKNILQKIYNKFLKLRNFIKKQINHIFLMYIYETDKMRGISELLLICGNIIRKYVLPLKEEHMHFLNKVLIPLHVPPLLHIYYQELVLCILDYIDKNIQLTTPILFGLLKYWPKTCSPKQIMFLNEVEEILDLIQPEEFLLVYKPVFEKLAACTTSDNFLIAHRSLIMYTNEYFTTLIDDNSNIIMPIIFPPLYHASYNHWNSSIRELLKQVLTFYEEINAELYEELNEESKKSDVEVKSLEMKKEYK